MEQRDIDLHGRFAHGRLARRALMARLAATAGSVAAASLVLPLIDRSRAQAEPALESPMTLASDPRITTSTVTIAGAPNLSGYLAVPVRPDLASTALPIHGRMPAVVLICENLGLSEHAKDMARRFATEGFVTLALDYLSPVGGTPIDPAAAEAMANKQNPEDVVAYARLAIAYLKKRPDVGRVGAVGFGKGGVRVNELASADPGLQAAVAYYGAAPDVAKVSMIRAPLLEHFAGLDERHIQAVPALEEALKRAGKTYQLYIYYYAKPGFTDDSDSGVYDQVSSEKAWGRTVAWLHKYLG